VRQDAEPGFHQQRKGLDMTEISTITAPARGLALASFDDAFRFSKMVASSDFAPKDFRGKPESCLLAIQHGSEIGLSPMQALQSIAVVNGRPSVYGDTALAVVIASPVCEFVRERIEGDGDQMVAVCEAKRKGYERANVVTFSVADAKKAGLWGKSGPWTQYSRRMLQMRARGFCLRDTFPDVLRGLVTVEEAQDYAVAHDAHPVTVTQPEQALEPKAVRAASAEDMVKALKAINATRDIGKLGDFLSTVNERYEAGFYTVNQADELRNTIDNAVALLNEREEVPA
jgi:hypothetical protein